MWMIVLVALLAGMCVLQYQHLLTLKQVAHAMEVRMQPTNVLRHTYYSNGVLITVDTTRETGESLSHWQRRHIDEIEKSWQDFPPTGE